MKLVALLLGVACVMSAQFETAEVLGTITDKSGGSVTKSTVTLVNQGTGNQVKTATDANGNYDFANVQVGEYTVTAEAVGFSKSTAADIHVDVEARQRVDLVLQVGDVSQSVEVSSAAAPIDTDSSEHSQVITTVPIVELPLNGRDYTTLALLSSNVHISPQAGQLLSQCNAARGRLQRQRHAQHL